MVCTRHRYVAYSSDIGESFRPVANPAWVNASYGVAIAYIVGDVAYHGYKAKEEGKDNVVSPCTIFIRFGSSNPCT